MAESSENWMSWVRLIVAHRWITCAHSDFQLPSADTFWQVVWTKVCFSSHALDSSWYQSSTSWRAFSLLWGRRREANRGHYRSKQQRIPGIHLLLLGSLCSISHAGRKFGKLQLVLWNWKETVCETEKHTLPENHEQISGKIWCGKPLFIMGKRTSHTLIHQTVRSDVHPSLSKIWFDIYLIDLLQNHRLLTCMQLWSMWTTYNDWKQQPGI